MKIKFRDLLLIPNLLSLFRLVLLFPLCYLILYQFETQKSVIIFIMIVMYITDLTDGYIARRFNQVSETGKIIDPLADKISVIVIAILLFLKGLLPLWFLLIIIIRDILILIFGLRLKKKTGKVLMSNYPGKIAVLGIGVVLLLNLMQISVITEFISYFYYIILILIIYSSYLYYKRYKQTIGEIFDGNH